MCIKKSLIKKKNKKKTTDVLKKTVNLKIKINIFLQRKITKLTEKMRKMNFSIFNFFKKIIKNIFQPIPYFLNHVYYILFLISHCVKRVLTFHWLSLVFHFEHHPTSNANKQ